MTYNKTMNQKPLTDSKFEAWMLFAHRLFNTEHMLYVEQSGRVVSADDMKKVIFFIYICNLYKYKLTYIGYFIIFSHTLL